LDSSLDRQTRHEWTKKESLALTLRGDYLKIYQVQPNKGESRESIPVIWLILGFTISASHKVPFNRNSMCLFLPLVPADQFGVGQNVPVE
jgi:hypothetical protein